MKRKGKPMKHFAKETKKMLAFLVAIILMFGCVQTNVLFANATGLTDNSFVSEMELGGATVSDNSISGNTISGNTVSDNVITEETVSGNTVSGNDVTDESVSGNTVSGNDVSEENESDESVSGNEAIEDTSEETVSDNNPVEPVVSGNTVSCNEPDEKVVIDHDMEGSLSKKPSRPVICRIVDGLPFVCENNKKEIVVGVKVVFEIKAQSGSKIYYSTNGKNPTYKNGLPSSNAQLYSSKITISNQKSVVLKAIAVNAAGLCSPVTTIKLELTGEVGKFTLSAPGGTTSNEILTVNVARGKSTNYKVHMPSYFYDPIKEGLMFCEVLETPKNSGNGVKVSGNSKITVSKDAKPGKYKYRCYCRIGLKYADITINVVESPTITSLKAKKKTVELTTIGTTATSYNIFNDIEYKASETLKATNFVWESSDTNVATVKDGVVKTVPGVKGKTTITATAKDGSLKSVKFTVKVSQQATKVEITGSSKVGLGKSIQLKANVYPLNVANSKVKWEMVDAVDNTVKINSKGKLTVSKKANKGSYTVKATTLDGSNKSDTFTVDVYDAIRTVEIAEKSLTLYRTNGNKTISAATSKTISAYGEYDEISISDDIEVINNRPGLVTAKFDNFKLTITATGNGTGTATITCRAIDGSGKKNTIKVKVVNPPSSIDIKLPNGSTGDLARGKKYKPDAILGTTYGNPGSVKVKWSFAQPLPGMTINENTGEIKVASDIPAGQQAKITATVQGDLKLSKTITVTVREQVNKISLRMSADESWDNKSIEMYENVPNNKFKVFVQQKGYSDFLNLTNDSVKTTKNVLITSNKVDLSVSYDSKNNKITLKSAKKGTYKVTIKVLDGTGKSKTHTIKVKVVPSS